MKIKHLLIYCSTFFYVAQIFAADNPSLSLVNISTSSDVAISLHASNIKSLNNIKFTGLNGMQIIGKQVSFNSSNINRDNYSSKIFLLPKQAGTYHIAVSAELDGKAINTTPITLIVTNEQLQTAKSNLQKNIKQENQQMAQMQKQINHQMQEQIQFFNNINTAIQKEQQLSSSNL